MPKGILQGHMKEMLEEMMQYKTLQFDSVQQLLKNELRSLSD